VDFAGHSAIIFYYKVSVVELSCIGKGKERGWIIMGHAEGLGSYPAVEGYTEGNMKEGGDLASLE
jgi:hypothetical protein